MNWYQGFERWVREDVPLAPMTTYKLGGPARFFATPPDTATLSRLLERAAEAQLPVRVLGRGANLLVADCGIGGLVVRLPRSAFSYIQPEDLDRGQAPNRIQPRVGASPFVRAGAAYTLSELVSFTVERGLGGAEILQGIPGTLGAAVRMNAGGKYGDISGCVRLVRGVTLHGAGFEFSQAQCGFRYRQSNLKERIVTECVLELAPDNPVILKNRAAEIKREKWATQPMTERSAGCVFKNPKVPHASSAGRLLDQLGLKGLQVGGAAVSNVHANFLICRAAARAADVVELIRTIRARVQAAYGVLLELEIELWGLSS